MTRTRSPILLLAAGMVGLLALVVLRLAERTRGDADPLHRLDFGVITATAQPVTPFTVECNAVVVAESVVLTVDHCVAPRQQVQVGSSSICSPDGWQAVNEGWWRPLVGEVNAASLAPASDLFDRPPVAEVGDTVLIVGFGRLTGGGRAACERQTIEAEIVRPDECDFGIEHEERMLCLGGVTVCPGFSGSAVVTTSGGLLGLVDRGDSCITSSGNVAAARPYRPMSTGG